MTGRHERATTLQQAVTGFVIGAAIVLVIGGALMLIDWAQTK